MIRLLTFLLLLAPLRAWALETAPVSTTHTAATLVSEADSYVPGRAFRVGLRLKIAPGWHTYWSNPGDAGAPPTLDISGATAGPIVYPTPSHEQDGPFTSFVYLNEVLLPVVVTPPAGTGTVHVQAHATWLVCQKVCVPEEAAFTLDVPAGDGAAGPQAGLFTAADAASPRPSPFAAHIGADGTLRLDAPGVAPEAVYFYPADAGVIDQGAAQPFTVGASGLTVRLKPLGKVLAAKPLAGVLILTDRMGHSEALQISASPGGAGSAPAPSGVVHALVLAFLGGLILNLMPCVLPVLAMKALALAKLSGAARQRIRVESLLYTAGVLAAFGAIGAAILVAGALGGAAGWGVQFQSAWFCAAMALVMLAIGLNFSGLFEVGAGVAGVGQSLAARGSFFTGLLAVVVATPCTAPFMATALAAAVALPPVDGMAIFLALGVGLAAPYALLAVAPGLAGFLPRPGAWMERLRHVLAWPMYATAAWLAWVVWRQAGPAGLAAVLGAGIAVGVAAALYGQRQRGERLDLQSAGLAAAMIALTVTGLSTQLPAATPAALAAGSEKFTPARLAALRAAHRPVLVDMSAAWCITCLVNERVALSPAPVRAAFARHNVAYLVGDWTQQDPDITAFLKEYGRDGVPLYVYFPADGAPQVLPQILTEAEILAASAPDSAIRDAALRLGFDAVGFAPAALGPQARTRLRDFLAAGQHGDMGWLADRAEQRGDPGVLWPEARSVVAVGLSYAPGFDALETLARPDRGNISVYARNRDYHDVLKGKLKHLAQFMVSAFGAGVKVFVDTAPVMEKPLAERAGLGWQGKHTNLVSRAHGSWLFLGEVFTTLEIEPSVHEAGSCGSCDACLRVCPTDAFPAPYRLDARRCISYLTIEHRGPIPVELRAKMGNRIYGCDDCLAVCPWNKFAQPGRDAKLRPREDLAAPMLAELAALDDARFRARFAGSPVKRIGRDRFVRNVMIAVGNSGDAALLGVAQRGAADGDAVVAEAAAWAAARLRAC